MVGTAPVIGATLYDKPDEPAQKEVDPLIEPGTGTAPGV